MNRRIHKLVVWTEMYRAGFTPAERRAFFAAWVKPAGTMTAAECELMVRHYQWLAVRKQAGAWRLMLRVYRNRVARLGGA